MNLKFKTQWSIAGGSASQKTNNFLIVEKDDQQGWGEISSSTKNNDIIKIRQDLENTDLTQIQSLSDIYGLEVCSPVKAGLEMAWIHLQCKLNGQSIFSFLNIPPVSSAITSFSVPILSATETTDYIKMFGVTNFPSCKIKIDGINSVDSVLAAAKKYDGPIRLDANESFQSASEALDFLKRTAGANIELLEQPLHKDNKKESKILKAEAAVPIVGDESLTNNNVTEEYLDYFHGLNIKLMKAGGYKQALEQLNQCRKIGLKTMVGCMVETSLNISSALNISANCDWLDLDGHLLLEKDPFLMLNENNGTLSLRSQ